MDSIYQQITHVNFILFKLLKRKCAVSLFCELCAMVCEYYDFEMEKRHGLILLNIKFRNLARLGTKSVLKMLKLF